MGQRVRHVGVTSRVVMLAMPPVLVIVGLASLLLVQQLQRARGADRIASLSSLTTDIGALVHELQKERGTSNVVLASAGAQFRPELDGQRTKTSDKLAIFDRHLAGVPASPGSFLADRLEVARADLAQLPDVRAHIASLDLRPEESFAYFTTLIAHLLDVVVESGSSVQDPSATRTFLALFDLMQAKERAGQERATGAAGFGVGHFPPELLERFRRLKSEQDDFLKTFASYATESQRAILQAQLANPLNADVERMRQLILGPGAGDHPQLVDGPTWFKAATKRIDLLRQVEIGLSDGLETTQKREADAARTVFRVALGGLLALIGAVGTWSIAVGRSLARPISRMTQVMTLLADGDVGVSVPGRERRDEIGAMANAVEVFRSNAIIRKEREAEIRHLLHHDTLTGILNRAAFQERVETTVQAVARGETAAIFAIDFDQFKTINDTLGHLVGDAYLRQVAARMQACLGERDCIARLGGDEFAIIQGGPLEPDAVGTLADKLLDAVGLPLDLDGQTLTPRMSVGSALAPRDGTEAERLLKGADIALYQAKAAGGHRHLVYDPGMDLRLRARQRLEADLRQAIVHGEFELVYQPLVDARTEDVVGFEALIRWNHPTRGVVSPAEFIPVAEETGLIRQIGAWVLDTACAEAKTWPDALSVAVNLSPVQFNQDDLLRMVDDSLRRSGLRAGRLELEITESVLLRDDAGTIAVLHSLRGVGVKIAMDDFGTGYSSLGYLRSFPFDKIKIDRSFVQRLGVTKDADVIVRAVVMLGKSLGMAVTAEGVETVEQLLRLRQEACDQLQGFLFSPPVQRKDIGRLVSRPVATLPAVSLAS